MNLSHTWEMCTRPSWCTPMSTNTPKSTTFRTVPLKAMPGFKSLMSSTSVRRMGAGSSSRMSRPGFTSSFTTSCSVGRPTPSSAASFSSPSSFTFWGSAAASPAFTSASV